MRSCLRQAALAGSFGDAKHFGDLRVCIAFDVVHDDGGSINLRQIFNRPVQALSENRVDSCTLRADRVNVLEVRFPFPEPFDLSHRVRDDGDRDAMEPGRERRVPAEAGQLTERSNECVLRELAGQSGVPSQSEGKPIDPSRVRVVELARRDSVTGKDPSDQVGFAHLLIGLKCNACSSHVLPVRCVRHEKGSIEVVGIPGASRLLLLRGIPEGGSADAKTLAVHQRSNCLALVGIEGSD